eukprot:2047552-Prymnesium_polylepis.1
MCPDDHERAAQPPPRLRTVHYSQGSSLSESSYRNPPGGSLSSISHAIFRRSARRAAPPAGHTVHRSLADKTNTTTHASTAIRENKRGE